MSIENGKWGQWTRGDHVEEYSRPDWIMFHPAGRVLYHDGGPYGIEISELKGDLPFWLHHIAGKGWGDSNTLTNLARAWKDITGADDDQWAHAIVLVSEAIDRESA